MAVNQAAAQRDPLAEAVEAMRASTDPGWPDLATDVMTSVRAQRRGGRPVRTDLSGLVGRSLGPRDTIKVNDQVVLGAIRTNMQQISGVAPYRIALRLTKDACDGIEIDLVAAYGIDLAAAADQARAAAMAAVDELLGLSSSPIDVHVGDVTATDPRA